MRGFGSEEVPDDLEGTVAMRRRAAGRASKGFFGGIKARGWGAIVDPGASWEVGFSRTCEKGRRRAPAAVNGRVR